MQKIFSLLCFMIIGVISMKDAFAEPYRQKPNPDEVGFYFRGISLPLNRIILIRKDKRYCALKFVSAWIEMDEERLKLRADDIKKGGIIAETAREAAEKKYAAYKSYYHKDGIPVFTSEGIQQKEGTASLLPLRGPFRPFVYQPGNGCVECGEFKLLWAYKTFVSFIPLGKSSSMRDYGIELAPTPWTEIKEINIKDPRIRWYRYDETRKKTFISIDKLWEDGQ